MGSLARGHSHGYQDIRIIVHISATAHLCYWQIGTIALNGIQQGAISKSSLDARLDK